MTPPTRRYTVIQEKSQVETELIGAIFQHRKAELDLSTETGVLHVSFRITATTHDSTESLFIGVTDQHQTINLCLQIIGEVFVLLPNS